MTGVVRSTRGHGLWWALLGVLLLIGIVGVLVRQTGSATSTPDPPPVGAPAGPVGSCELDVRAVIPYLQLTDRYAELTLTPEVWLGLAVADADSASRLPPDGRDALHRLARLLITRR